MEKSTRESRKPQTRSKEQLLHYLGELQQKTKRKRPQPLPDGTLAEWLEDWLKLCQQVGIERFEAALHRCWLEIDFFPTPNQIRERVPESGSTMRVTIDEKCEWCWGTGWRPASGEPRSQETRFKPMKRCDCRRVEYQVSA